MISDFKFGAMDAMRRSVGLLVIGMTAICLVSLACEDGCTEDERRCNGNKVEICADGDWLLDDDCNEVTTFDFTVERWQCCERETAVCLPKCEVL